MKKALSLFINYIFWFCILTFLASFLYMQEIQLTKLVAGKNLPLFNGKLFLQGFINFFPICSIFALLTFCFYLIRHKFTFLQYFFVYAFICILVFFFALPTGLYLQNKYSINHSELSNQLTPLSSGYFRPSKGDIDYYISTKSDGTSEILHINLGNEKGFENITTQKVSQKAGDYENFSDPLIYDLFGKSAFPKIITQGFLFLNYKLKESVGEGFFSFLGFLTMGFALASTIGIRRLAKWRLLNMINVLLGFFGIFILNYFLYASHIYEKFTFLINVKSWLPIAVNIFIGLIFSITGILCETLKPDPNRESD